MMSPERASCVLYTRIGKPATGLGQQLDNDKQDCSQGDNRQQYRLVAAGYRVKSDLADPWNTKIGLQQQTAGDDHQRYGVQQLA